MQTNLVRLAYRIIDFQLVHLAPRTDNKVGESMIGKSHNRTGAAARQLDKRPKSTPRVYHISLAP